jgi:HSP20 family molecular chaperone IbpA
MPGVNKQGVEITVEDGKLIIGGNRSPEGKFGQAVYRERRTGDYRRVFDLDPSMTQRESALASSRSADRSSTQDGSRQTTKVTVG